MVPGGWSSDSTCHVRILKFVLCVNCPLMLRGGEHSRGKSFVAELSTVSDSSFDG